jgi:integrase
VLNEEIDPEKLLMGSWYLRRGAREWIQSYPSIKKMAYSIVGRRRRGSPATVNGYITGIMRYLEYMGFSDPEEALGKIKGSGFDPVGSINAEGTGFIDAMLRKYANKTVHTYVYGVKKWFEVNEVGADWSRVEMPTTSVTRERDRAPTVDEIRKLLSHATNIKDRVVTLILLSSGLRIGTLLSLKWGDVDFDYLDVARITVRRAPGRKFSSRGARGGESQLFITWISPEAKETLLEYRRYRESKGEEITPSSPLIESDQKAGEHLTVSGFHHRWYRILERAGLDQKSVRFHVLHVHTLRKYFRSRCVGVDPSYREQWMGHKGGYLDESYFKAEEEFHLREYRKVIPYISVYDNPAQLEQRKQALLDFARFQGWSSREISELESILGESVDIDDAATKFREFKVRSIENGRHVVIENDRDLVDYLNDGWELVSELDTNKFLLRK